MIRIYALIFVALFVCGCAVGGTDSPKGDFDKSVELKDFEPLIKEASSQKPINIDELGIENLGDKDSVAFYDAPQVKILELLKAYQKEHFRFNESLENLAKDKTQKDFVEHYKIAQRNILLGALIRYHNTDIEKRISYDEFANITNSFFTEQGQFIMDFGEYFFMALDNIESTEICKEDSCGHGTEMFNLMNIYVNLKEQNKLNDRLKRIFNYGRKGQNDYIRINFAYKGIELWHDRLNIKNLFATKPSKKQMYDFVGEFDLDYMSEDLEIFMDFWTEIYLMRLYAAKYGIEIALGNENAKSIIESNPEVCLFDIYLDKNATKICENLALTQRMVKDFMAKIAKPDRKFLTIFDDKMCAIVDFGALDSEKYVGNSKKPKIITNPNNKSISCNAVKEALQKIDLQNSRAKISGEWEMLEFLLSDKNINKQNEVDSCHSKGDDSAICDKILDTWSESCARGEEKYCIAIFAIHSKSHYECSETGNSPALKQYCDNENSKIDKSLTLLKQNCDKGMANSCHAVGEFYNMLYIENRSKEESQKAPQMLDEALLYFQKSCDLDMAMSCISIASVLEIKYEYWDLQDTKQVKIYADKARAISDKDCKAGVKMACDFKESYMEIK